jgi:hypothetical protein
MRQITLRPLAMFTIGAACATLLTACPHQGEGPAERVGKAADKGVAAVGKGVEKTGEVIQGAATGK